MKGSDRMSPRTARRPHAIGVWVAAVAIGMATTFVPSTSASAAPTVTLATGDMRTVTEPSVPDNVCGLVEAQLPDSGRTFSSSQEANPPDTARIQRALDSCARSSGTVAVELAATDTHNAFLTGPLTIHSGEVLLVDSGVTLYGSRDAANYQVSGGPTCGTLSSSTGGCKPLIQVSGANAGIEALQDSSGHQGTIDGRGDQTILGTSTTWWKLADEAKTAGKNQQNPRLIQASKSNNFTLYHINLVNSPNFHVGYEGGNGFTAWGVRIKTPANARNTDGTDPAAATNVTTAYSSIQDGDDGIAIKGGSATSNMTIRNNGFWGTHGISIGSEVNGGVKNILFENNTLNGVDSSGITSSSDNGIRIKSSPKNGGLVTQVTYLATCMTGMKAPIVLDTHYSSGSRSLSTTFADIVIDLIDGVLAAFSDPDAQSLLKGHGSSIPTYNSIVIDGVLAAHSDSHAQSVFNGYDSSHLLGVTLANVNLDVSNSTAKYAQVQLYNSNIVPLGSNVPVAEFSGSGEVPSCTFPAYPAL